MQTTIPQSAWTEVTSSKADGRPRFAQGLARLRAHPISAALLFWLIFVLASAGFGVGAKVLLPQFQPEFVALCALSVAIAFWLTRSRFGARLAAIRENEDAAEALGVDTLREKTRVLMLSGALAGMGGTFYAQYFLYIDPVISYGVERSVEMLLVSMIGGAGTVLGPLVGSFVLTTIGEVTREASNTRGLGLAVYGALLVVIVAFLPDGLTQLARRWRRHA